MMNERSKLTYFGSSDELRVLIVRLGAIGDVVISTPVLCALREQFPRAYLSWLVESPAAPLLEGHAALDRLIVVPRRWLKSPREVWQLRRQLREMSFDVAIDMQGLAKSAVAAWLSGAPRRIGFAPGDFEGRELSSWINNERVTPRCAHVVNRGLELLHPLGIKQCASRFDLPTSSRDATEAQCTIERLGLGNGFAILNPGAGWPSKLWPTGRYAAVARHLGRAHGVPSLVAWVGDREHQLANAIVQDAEGDARVAPPTSLRQLLALERRALLLVASDTGPLHMAAAVGTPCVGLYGPMSAVRTGPYGPLHIVLQEACLSGSSRERRRASNDSMRAIRTEQVCAACDQILARHLRWQCA